MAYQNNIPRPTDAKNKSQADMLGNFAAISTLLNVNHVNFDLADQGKHKWVTMPVQTMAPGTTATDWALFSQADGLYIQAQNSVAAVNFTGATKASNGQTTLPSGVKLKWGSGVTNGAGISTFTFASLGLTAFVGIYNVQATCATTADPGNPENQVFARVNAFSNASLTISTLRMGALGGNPATAHFSWFAVGV